ncbi:hypothetical protein ASD42_32670 [Nocardia sp. Root136]|nr:hypothetical protein ASD42_32670 [Nocardia sp. Root136]
MGLLSDCRRAAPVHLTRLSGMMPTISSLQNATASSFLVSGIIEVIRCTTSSICLRDRFFTMSFDHFGPRHGACAM